MANDNLEKEVFLGINIPENVSYKGYIMISVLSCALLIYLISILNVFKKVAKDLSERHVFTKNNGEQLAKVGKGFLIFGVGLVVFQIVLKLSFIIDNFFIEEKGINHSIGYTIGYTIGYSLKFLVTTGLPIFMGSLFLFIISHLINEGHYLKQENDLTI